MPEFLDHQMMPNPTEKHKPVWIPESVFYDFKAVCEAHGLTVIDLTLEFMRAAVKGFANESQRSAGI